MLTSTTAKPIRFASDAIPLSGPGGIGIAVAGVLDQRRVRRRRPGPSASGSARQRPARRRAGRRVHVDRQLRAVAGGQVAVAAASGSAGCRPRARWCRPGRRAPSSGPDSRVAVRGARGSRFRGPRCGIAHRPASPPPWKQPCGRRGRAAMPARRDPVRSRRPARRCRVLRAGPRRSRVRLPPSIRPRARRRSAPRAAEQRFPCGLPTTRGECSPVVNANVAVPGVASRARPATWRAAAPLAGASRSVGGSPCRAADPS